MLHSLMLLELLSDYERPDKLQPLHFTDAHFELAAAITLFESVTNP
jgi:hypothetical protein